MSKRVIYSYINNDERRYIVDCLYKEHDWKPVFFHGHEEMRPWISKNYPDAILHDSMAMRQAKLDYSRLGDPIPIDTEIIYALSKFESTYLGWLQDTTGWNFSFFERRDYYFNVLTYWNTVINIIQPDIFIANTWPHLTSDYPLYLLCKHYYSIPVLFLNPIAFLNDSYHTVGTSLENLSSSFEVLYRSDLKLEASNVVENYISTLKSNRPKVPHYVSEYWHRLDDRNRRKYMDFILIIRLILSGNAFKTSPHAFKKNRKYWESDSARLNYLEYIMFRRKLTRKAKRLKKFYNKIAKKPIQKEKYVYFAASFQPEVTSNISVGSYEDTILVLNMISNSIPDEWLIYYKEHPSTFKETAKGTLMRSKQFYQKIGALKKVKIIPFDMDTFTLIDNSQAVCTVGGTVGWEAMVRKKPAIAFGGIWYQTCKSLFDIKSLDDCQNAIKEIINGFVPDEKDIERFAESIYQACEKDLIANNNFTKNIKNCQDPKYEMKRVADAYYKAYKEHYGEK